MPSRPAEGRLSTSTRGRTGDGRLRNDPPEFRDIEMYFRRVGVFIFSTNPM
jgi:hypothetical protein